VIGIKSFRRPDVASEDVIDVALAFGSPDVLVTLESDIVRAVNPAALRMLGLAEGANPVGGPLDPWWPESTRSDLQRALTAARPGHPHRFRARFSKPQPTWWDCTAFRLPDVPHTVSLSCRDVTELVEIRSALALADARLRALTEHPRSVSWFMRKDGTLTQTSQRWRTFTGIDQPVCDMATWLELIHPEDRNRVLHDTRITLAGTDTRETTYRTRRADGEYRWVRRRTMPVHDAGGKLIEWVGFATDVTEAREVEAQSRLLQQLVDTTPNLIALADPDGRLRYMNPAGRELVGIAPDVDVTKLPPSDYTAPESLTLLENVVVPTARDRGIWEGEMQLINRETGALIDIHRITLGLRDEDGRHIGYSTVTRNITDAKRARAALAESERRFRGTFEQAAVGIAHVSLDGHWLFVNARLCEFLGYSEADLRKLTFQELTHPDALASDLEQGKALLAGTLATYTMEKRYRLVMATSFGPA
jgi:PAS domain S-box-containing protein